MYTDTESIPALSKYHLPPPTSSSLGSAPASTSSTHILQGVGVGGGGGFLRTDGLGASTTGGGERGGQGGDDGTSSSALKASTNPTP